MADTIRFEIVTPVAAVYSGEATSVVLPSERGEIEILPGHRAMLALVGHGTVVVTEAGTKKTIVLVVEPGYVETVDDKVTLLVSGCLHASDVDAAAAHADMIAAEKALFEPNLLDEEALDLETERVARARARVDMINRATGKN